ncbi:MAG: DUF6510 family protein [Actinomycetota bacterium]|nr:DUF6510 family protein [Actinomycetota bacterium]
MSELYEDGNALAGPLADIFAVDLTVAIQRCAGCGQSGPIATLRLYRHAPGLVARCPGCDGVVLRLVHTPDAVFLDLTGALNVKIPLEA